MKNQDPLDQALAYSILAEDLKSKANAEYAAYLQQTRLVVLALAIGSFLGLFLFLI